MYVDIMTGEKLSTKVANMDIGQCSFIQQERRGWGKGGVLGIGILASDRFQFIRININLVQDPQIHSCKQNIW